MSFAIINGVPERLTPMASFSSSKASRAPFLFQY